MDPKLNEQEQARNFYFNTDFTQDQICELLNINRKTLYGWIKEGGWKSARYAAAHAPTLLIEQYYQQLGAINNHIAQRESQPWPSKEEGDTIRRLTMAIKHIRTMKPTVVENIQVFHAFTDKLRKKDLKLLQEITPHLDKHIKSLTEDGQWLNYSRTQLEEAALDKEYGEWVAAQQQTQLVPSPTATAPTPPPAGDTPPAAPPGSPAPTPPPFINGVTNGVTDTPENNLKPAPDNTSENRNNIDLSTKKTDPRPEKRKTPGENFSAKKMERLRDNDPLKYWAIRLAQIRKDLGMPEDDDSSEAA